MARAATEARQAELRTAIADYILEHGVADLSLRPVAEALGTSARMLVYHFGSRDALVVAAIEAVRERGQTMLRAFPTDGHQSFREIARAYWEWVTAEDMLPVMRLSGEIHSMALREPDRFPGYAQRHVESWLRETQHLLTRYGMAPARARRTATLLSAAVTGLVMDLLATGDRARVDAAAEALIEGITEGLEDGAHDRNTG